MKLSELMKNGTFHEVETSEVSPEDYFFLEDVMKEQAGELITEEKKNGNLPESFDTETLTKSLVYSLSCCQGDGVAFRDGSTDYVEDKRNGASVKFFIITNDYANHYTHEKTFAVDFSTDGELPTSKQEDKWAKDAGEYTEVLRAICKELEDTGYEHIQEEDKRYNAEHIGRVFCTKNGIEIDDMDILDYLSHTPYGTSTIKIGKSDYSEAYISDIELDEHTRDTVEDGGIVKSEKFYTLKS